MECWDPVTAGGDGNPGRFCYCPEYLVGFMFDFFLFVSDEWDDVLHDVEGRDSRVACTGHGLHRRYDDGFEPEVVLERFERERQNGGRTVGVSDYETVRLHPSLLFIHHLSVFRVYFGIQERDELIHSVR